MNLGILFNELPRSFRIEIIKCSNKDGLTSEWLKKIEGSTKRLTKWGTACCRSFIALFTLIEPKKRVELFPSEEYTILVPLKDPHESSAFLMKLMIGATAHGIGNNTMPFVTQALTPSAWSAIFTVKITSASSVSG